MAQPNWYRICVGCGKARHKKELLRIVKSPGNHLEIDRAQDKPGRGAYICPKTECAMIAKKRQSFNRTFRMEIGQEFYNDLIQWMAQIEH